MIDMVFLLLIFFLVATSFHQEEREIQIALPTAQSAAPISVALREIVINVDERGGLIVGGRQIELEDLQTLVSEATTVNPEQKVTVRGDRRTAYDNVVRVLDVCKGAGVQEPYLDTVLAE
ncbi:MAG: biopolymer transporter ExbD [bacterium]|nr:biopolymer transporter ExbD [bacterium]